MHKMDRKYILHNFHRAFAILRTMKNAIILHGLYTKNEDYDPNEPSPSNNHWLPWLQRQLQLHDIKADTPEVANTYEMKWEPWVKEFERFDRTPETTLVGHSMGGGFLVRYLSERPELRVAKVVLVAPWLNLSHEEDTVFFDFILNPAITAQAGSFTVFASDNDNKDVTDSVDFLREKLPAAKFRDFHHYGHFCLSDMKTDAFPDLLAEVID